MELAAFCAYSSLHGYKVQAKVSYPDHSQLYCPNCMPFLPIAPSPATATRMSMTQLQADLDAAQKANQRLTDKLTAQEADNAKLRQQAPDINRRDSAVSELGNLQTIVATLKRSNGELQAQLSDLELAYKDLASRHNNGGVNANKQADQADCRAQMADEASRNQLALEEKNREINSLEEELTEAKTQNADADKLRSDLDDARQSSLTVSHSLHVD